MTEDERKKMAEQVQSASQYLCDQGYRDAASIPAVAVVDLMVGWHRQLSLQPAPRREPEPPHHRWCSGEHGPDVPCILR